MKVNISVALSTPAEEWGKLEERDHKENQGIDEIILKCILKNKKAVVGCMFPGRYRN